MKDTACCTDDLVLGSQGGRGSREAGQLWRVSEKGQAVPVTVMAPGTPLRPSGGGHCCSSRKGDMPDTEEEGRGGGTWEGGGLGAGFLGATSHFRPVPLCRWHAAAEVHL